MVKLSTGYKLKQAKQNDERWFTINPDNVDSKELKGLIEQGIKNSFWSYTNKKLNLKQYFNDNLRKRVLQNDCYFCNKKSKQAHHITFKSESVLGINEEENLISLCESCHIKLHKIFRLREKLITQYTSKANEFYNDNEKIKEKGLLSLNKQYPHPIISSGESK